MYTTSLRKVGGSVMLAVPPAILELLNLKAGAAVGVEVDDGRLVILPQGKRYTLEELLFQCDASATATAEDQAWLSGKSEGTELI
jgi:antitoxin ChpS